MHAPYPTFSDADVWRTVQAFVSNRLSLALLRHRIDDYYLNAPPHWFTGATSDFLHEARELVIMTSESPCAGDRPHGVLDAGELRCALGAMWARQCPPSERESPD